MTKATVIATCLLNSGMYTRLENAEARVESVFRIEFPDREFRLWNTNLSDSHAATIIQSVGRASRINVRLFIEDLSSDH